MAAASWQRKRQYTEHVTTPRHKAINNGNRAIGTAAGRGMACSSSIMRIVIALSQAWYIDSNMNKYHKDILLFLVIANYYLSIDI